MSVINPKYWEERFAQGTWSGEKWLDWEHGVISRHAFRRIFPRDVKWVLDVGCGDGKWTRWMRKEFGVQTLGTDALDWPEVRGNTAYVHWDAESLEESSSIRGMKPDLVVLMNSLTCMVEWRKAVKSACKVSDRVLVFDNFMTPTPQFLKGLPHRRPIELPQVLCEFIAQFFTLEKMVPADIFHRRLLLKTPRWSHPGVAAITCGLDLIASHVIRVADARHSALLFRKDPTIKKLEEAVGA